MRQKTPLVLMELGIMLGVFALAAALCLQGFAAAGRISRESVRRDAAVTAAQNAAEVLRSTRGDLTESAEILGGAVSGQVWTLEYDGFCVTVTRDASDAWLGRASIAATGDDGAAIVAFDAAWQKGATE